MRRFRKLRTAMFDIGLEQRDLAKELNRSQRYISERLNAKRPWGLDEVFEICSLLKIPPSDIPEYFPVEDVTASGGGVPNV